MLKLIKKNTTPPNGGFFYIDKDTGFHFTAWNMHDLVQAVVKHRLSNQLDVKNMDEKIEDWLCEKMPMGVCEDERMRASGGMHMQTENTVNRTITTFKATRHIPKVDQEIAERRSSICIKCVNNVPYVGCSSCRGVKAIKVEMLDGRHVMKSESLLACKITGIMNEYSVFTEREALSGALSASLSKLPDTCWMKGE